MSGDVGCVGCLAKRDGVREDLSPERAALIVLTMTSVQGVAHVVGNLCVFHKNVFTDSERFYRETEMS